MLTRTGKVLHLLMTFGLGLKVFKNSIRSNMSYESSKLRPCNHLDHCYLVIRLINEFASVKNQQNN